MTVIYVLLLLLVLVALEVPLAIAVANHETDRTASDRLADVVRFATLAEPALRTGETADLHAELIRYDELYGIGVMVLDLDRQTVVTSRRNFDPVHSGQSAEIRQKIQQTVELALAGEQVGSGGPLWPWQEMPLVVAAPIGSGGEVLGSVITVSPSHQLRNRVRVTWVQLLIGGMLAIVAGIAVASSLARWTLKPVLELDNTVHRITAGNYAARVPPGLGPPELQRLSIAFNEMADAVTDALERKRAFVAHASHQLRNPLTALRLRVEDLAEELSTETALAEHRLALEETERLGDVLDGLLALARAEGGEHYLETVDAAGTVAERVAAWQPLADKRRIRLSAEAPAPVHVRAVATALDQSLDALIDNALKFAGSQAQIRVSVRLTKGGVAVHVTDNGPGLTDTQRRRAAERFWRAPTSQNIDGAGLGLAIVAELLKASGGQLDLLPARPHGLDARIWLPAADPPAQPTQVAPTKPGGS